MFEAIRETRPPSGFVRSEEALVEARDVSKKAYESHAHESSESPNFCRTLSDPFADCTVRYCEMGQFNFPAFRCRALVV